MNIVLHDNAEPASLTCENGSSVSETDIACSTIWRFPLNLTDDPLVCPGCGVILEEWRDETSRQDLNGDGTITLEESQETSFRAQVASHNLPFFYGSPRQIRFGAEIRF